jgi:hypothetical protein
MKRRGRPLKFQPLLNLPKEQKLVNFFPASKKRTIDVESENRNIDEREGDIIFFIISFLNL